MTNNSRIRIGIDMDELDAMTYMHATARAYIDQDGARGIWNGFGRARITVEGNAVLDLHIHEDSRGEVVLEVSALDRQLGKRGAPLIVELEREGVVPSRTARTR